MTAGIGIGALPTLAFADLVEDPLHGYCSGTAQCVDNGTNSPTGNNPPQNFGFTVSPGPQTGTLFVDILVPNNESSASSFAITGTLSGTATLFSATPWTSGDLASYLGISASPNNSIGAYLPSTVGLDPGATGFFVFQANLGTATLQDAPNPNVSPLLNLSGGQSLPLASYIVGFLNTGSPTAPNFIATANSGAIFETSGPPRVPEPTTLLLIGTSLLAVGAGAWRRRQR